MRWPLSVLGLLLGLSGYSDLVQDLYGSRALFLHLDPYPPVSHAAAYFGLSWNVSHASTHPPTAFLLTAPVAFFPWPVASMLWAWMMVLAVAGSLRLYGLRWGWIGLVVAVCLFWPPFVYSLSQLTPVWLLGTALAYHSRKQPFKAGVWIGFASLTKFLPAVLLIPFLLRRKWMTLTGFAAMWGAALLFLLALDRGSISRYVTVNEGNSLEMILRVDNGALLPMLYRFAGVYGMAAGLILLASVARRRHDEWQTWEFIAVALLPLAWVYSLLPLLPRMIARWKHPLIVASLAATLVMPPFGVHAAATIAVVFVLIALDGMFCRQTEQRLQVAADQVAIGQGRLK